MGKREVLNAEIGSKLRVDPELRADYEDYIWLQRGLDPHHVADRAENLDWAKVGVFQPVDQTELWHRLRMGRSFPDGILELVKVNDGTYVRGVRVRNKTLRGGSRRQRIKGQDLTFHTSEVFINVHAMSRLYERDRFRGLTPKDFFFKPSGWLDALHNHTSLAELNDEGGVFTIRRDILYPFGNGVFLGRFSLTPVDPVERYRWDSRGCNSTDGVKAEDRISPCFFAKTFVHADQLRDDQRDVYNLLVNQDWEVAARQMENLVPNDDHVDRHDHVFVLDSNSPGAKGRLRFADSDVDPDIHSFSKEDF